jgi:hypothetical protein
VAKKARTPAPPRPVQVPKRREDPRTRPSLGAANRNVVLGGAGIVALIAIAVGLWLAFGGGGTGSAKAVDWSTLGGLQTGPPPWNNGTATLPDRLAPLGLTQLSAEGTVIHIHQHVDLYVNGKKVTVPANVGIYANQWLTELHTHQGEPDIIHVESPTKTNYSLGQFFGVWGVRLTQDCVGRYCGAGKVSWWVNGVKQTGDPGKLVLKEHQEIAIAFGTPPKVVPKSFDFAKVGL